jgi:glycosyltransferase involved in cell wall biosynthesis
LVSVLLPTTGRPERAEACVRSLLRTTEGHDIEVCAAVDADHETAKRLDDLGCYIDFSDELRGNDAWNVALSFAVGDPIVFAADDLDFQPGWLDAALEALSEHPGCLIGFNDGHWGAELSTHYLMSRDFIIEVLGGRVAWGAHYPHSFNDAEVNERAKRANRYFWCEEARVYHSHWLFGDREKDETDTRNLGGHAAAEQKFRERQAAGFPDDLPPILTHAD